MYYRCYVYTTYNEIFRCFYIQPIMTFLGVCNIQLIMKFLGVCNIRTYKEIFSCILYTQPINDVFSCFYI